MPVALSGSWSTAPRGPRSYIMSLSYDEQLSNALRNFLELGLIGKDIGARLVTPFVQSSRLFGIPNFIPSVLPEDHVKIFPLTDVMNVEGLTNFCYEPDLVPESFLHFTGYSSRDVVVVYVVKTRSFLGGAGVGKKIHSDLTNPKIRKELFSCMRRNGKPHYCFCKDIVRPFLSKLQKALNSLSPSNPFRVLDAVCIHGSKVLHTEELLNAVREKTGKQILSFIFPDWNGLACPPSGNCTVGVRTRLVARTALNSHCNNTVEGITGRYNLFNRFIAREIHELAEKFVANQGITQDTQMLGAHIRMERMGRDFDEIQCCVDEFLTVLKDVLKRLSTSKTKLLLLTDSGSFGTQTCSLKCDNVTKFVTTRLHEHKLVPVRFDPIAYKTKESESFVALVELLALSYSTELVFMGSNSAFQRNILGNAVHAGRVKHVHLVCSGNPPTNTSDGVGKSSFALNYNKCKSHSV